MKKIQICSWLSFSAAIFLLSACAHTPRPSDIPPGSMFSTKILTNDTKLFTYALRLKRGPADAPDVVGETPERGGGAGRSAQLAQVAQRAINAQLAQNQYCRDGYVVLEQFEEQQKYIVRGECRDAATSADRELFPEK